MHGQWGQDPLAGNPRYTSIRTLHHNGRTFLQLALDRSTGEKVAIKFTQRGWDEGRNKYLLRELLIHQELSACAHPHIVEFRDAFLTPTHLASVVEYVEGEDLQTFLANTGGRVSEALGRFLFQQLVLALDFCHARGKVSRGVKLANTLLALSPGQLPLVKLADFGTSKDASMHSAPSSQVGTALFVPPEVMHNFSNAPYDGALVDVWACGIVLFMLLFGRHPCLRPEDGGLSEQQQLLALFTRTAASQFCLLPEEAAAISPACADLLGHMLKTDPKDRYTMAQVQAHPWFKQGLPEGAALMNAAILAEAATRPLPLKHSPEALAALVRHGQKLDPQAMGSFGSSQAAAGGGTGGPSTAVNIPNSPPNSQDAAAAAAAARLGGGCSSGGSIAARVASSSAAAGAVAASMDEDTPHAPWGGPPPSRLLIHSCSSNDKAAGLQYKALEEQMLRSGVVPPARFHMSESMSSSHGSFIAQHHQQRSATAQQQQQQQQQQNELATLLESIPSAGLEETLAQSPQQQQQVPMQQQVQQAPVPMPTQQQQQQQQFNVWTPQPGFSGATTSAHPLSSSGTTSAGAVAGASQGGGGRTQSEVASQAHSAGHSGGGGGGVVSPGLAQQVQQQQAQLQAMALQQRQQEMLSQQQQQQQQQVVPVAMNGGAATAAAAAGQKQMSLLNSADLEALLPLGSMPPAAAAAAAASGGSSGQQQQPPGASPPAAAAAGGGRGLGFEQQSSFIKLLEGIDSLPMALDSSIDALLNPAANPLLNAPMPDQYMAQQQQLGGHAAASAAAAVSGGSPYSSPAAAAAASPAGSLGAAASQQQQQQQQQQGGGGMDIPDDYAAFLVDEDDLAAVGSEGAAGQRKRVLSGAGAGISSCSLDLRQLSDLLMGGSGVQLLEGSAWHKLCRSSFSRGAGRSGPAAFGGGGGGAELGDDACTAAARGGGNGGGADDEDDLHDLLGLRDMSITR